MEPLIDWIAHQRTFRVEHSVPLAEWLLPVVDLELEPGAASYTWTVGER